MMITARNYQRGIDVALWLLDAMSSIELERRIHSPYPGPMPAEWIIETEPYKLIEGLSPKPAIAG